MLHAPPPGKDEDVGPPPELRLSLGHPHAGARSVREGANADILYFVRLDPRVDLTPENVATSVMWGVSKNGSAMESLLRAMESVYAPNLLNNRSWPDSVQKDFSTHTHKFMAQLTENTNRMRGQTVLYVPLVSLTDEEWKDAFTNKELVQTFVTAVIHWTRQIREVVVSKDSAAETENAGPLDEIAFWRARAMDLRNIRDQFNRPDVTRVVEALTPAKDAKWSLDPFNSLRSTIENHTDEAIDNLRYLKTLEEPCKRLAAATPKEIPHMVKEILKTVHLVFIHSKHYKKEHFYNLLRMISNEIVKRCLTQINLNDIFDGNVDRSMQALQESIDAGNTWSDACKKMIKATIKRYSRDKGERMEEDESVFNEIGGFVRRCKDLIEVCRGQQQFGFRPMRKDEMALMGGAAADDEDTPGASPTGGLPGGVPCAVKRDYKGVIPCFGGAKGGEIENQLLEIQREFKNKIERLRRLPYYILDVKATEWTDDFRAFKQELDSLGITMTQVIQSAFELVATVEQGAELLEAFFYLAKRDEVLSAVNKRQEIVVKLFREKEIESVRTLHTHNQGADTKKRDSGLPFFLHPPIAGPAVQARNFRFRVESSYRLLHRLWFLSDYQAKQETFEKYQSLEKDLEAYVKKMYGRWREVIDKMNPGLLLDEFLVVTKPLGEPGSEFHVLQVNFPVELQMLFEEARYWQRLGEPIPGPVQEVWHREERLRVSREVVGSAVASYNRIVTALDSPERRLFEKRIAYLDTPKVFGQAWSKVTWAMTGVELFGRQGREQAERVQLIVDEYKEGMRYIAHLQDVIATTLAVKIDSKTAYRVEQFEKEQEQHQAKMRAKITQCHTKIVDTLKKIFDHFKNDYKEHSGINIEWHTFLQRVDSKVEEAVKTMVKKSLIELSRALPEPKEKRRDGVSDALGNETHQVLELDVRAAQTVPNEGKPKLDTDPPINTVKEKMTKISQAVVSVVEKLPRLEEALMARIEQEIDEQQALAAERKVGAAAAAAAAGGSMAAAAAAPEISMNMMREPNYYKPLQSDAARAKDYYSELYQTDNNEVLTYLTQIDQAMNELGRQLNDHLGILSDKWVSGRGETSGMWNDIAAWEKRTKSQVTDGRSSIVDGFKVKIKAYGDEIKRLKGEGQDDAATMGAGSKVSPDLARGLPQQHSLLFVSLNQGPLRQRLLERCQEWQTKVRDVLYHKSLEDLTKLETDFKKTIEHLSQQPETLKKLQNQIAAAEQAVKNMPATQLKFEPLNEQFKMVGAHGGRLEGEDRKRLDNLLPLFEKYKEDVAKCRKQLEVYKEEFRATLDMDLKTFAVKCDELKKSLADDANLYASTISCAEAFQKIGDYKKTYAQRVEEQAKLKESQSYFEMTRDEGVEDLKEIAAELDVLTRVWEYKDKWQRECETWKKQPFKTLNTDDMDTITVNFSKDVYKLKASSVPGSVPMERRDVWIKLREEIERMKKVNPVAADLLLPAIRDRHWDQLRKHLRQQPDIRVPDDSEFNPEAPDFCLNLLLDLKVERQADFVANLATAAKQELKIETDLATIETAWEENTLALESYRTQYWKVATVEDINQNLQDHTQMLSSMKMSRFVEAFRPKVTRWEQTLSIINDTLDGLLMVQTKWMYLENIFMNSEDIPKKLPEEYTKFTAVNNDWKAIMGRIEQDKNVKRAMRRDGLLDHLNRMALQLEGIQKKLESFLEDRRRAFPRFYFLSNDDLLEILGHTRDPEKVQPHLRKCFEGLFKLDLQEQKRNKDKKVAKAMIAADTERVEFLTAVPGGEPKATSIDIDGAVEGWLLRVEERMRDTVRFCLIRTLDKLQRDVYNPKKKIDVKALRDWIKNCQGMSIITASQINWSVEVERVLKEYMARGGGGKRKRSPVYKLYKKWKILIKRYCAIVREKLDRLTRNKLVALITIEVHARDILNSLQAMKVSDPSNFEWTKQLRFYRRPDDTCAVKQTSAEVNYDYEYLGNSGRLVVTGLTDRAYMTLTTALQLHRGGLPQGPAGTGKTETVKDLGKGIAKYVMVFNCSDGLDYKSLGRMFSGLAQTGAWSCFDEFNRIEVEVLSVVAQQIFSILTAVSERKKNMNFEGNDIPLNLNCGIFVTMNPGYAGRSELPDNLKALLRPISMMVPDFALICEITLLSQGFETSKVLSRRVAILYELMDKQLSKQDHYDFSLRNIKAVLVQAGNLKRENFPGTEEQLCLKACSDMNLPKFVKDDVPLFSAMLEDLFPGVTPEDAGLEEFRTQAFVDLEANKLDRNEHIVVKVMHLWDTLCTRHGVMVVGRTGSGKTVTWQTLCGALRRLKAMGVGEFEPVRVNLVNPKSVTMDELYGSYNQATREWKDGILSDLMRNICRDESLVLKWILFDGPVDTLWIESMNTVLDDNKMLTLNSGERINLTPQISMVFEVEDLSQASPATVSRCGMVYFNVEDLGWQPYAKRWLEQRMELEVAINSPAPKDAVKTIREFMDEFLDDALDRRRRECVELFPTSDINAVRSFTHLVDAVANPDAMPFINHEKIMKFNPQAKSGEGAVDTYLANIKLVCIFALMWSVGGTLTEEARRKFEVRIREIDTSFPSSDTAFEYFPDYKTQTWRHWEEDPSVVAPFTAKDDAYFYELIVPTVDLVRYRFLISSLVTSSIHTVVVGNTGTGKSLNASTVLKSLPQDRYVSTQLNFSAQTSAKNVQDIIEGRMEHPSKKSCQPPGGRRMIVLVEDLNMPQKEKFGAQPPLELLRQWMDNGYWYDRATQSQRKVNEMQLLCCMTFGRPPITQRFLSKLNVLNVTFPAENVISKIFSSILNFRFQKTKGDFVGHIDLLVKATIQIYNKVTSTLLPIPSKSHYLFNLRDLAKVFQGIFGAYLEGMASKDELITLWMHECFRTFADRMNDLNDKAWFREQIVDRLQTLFQTKWTTVMRDKDPTRFPIFVDFWDGEYDEMAKYKFVPSNEALKQKLVDALDQFNEQPGGRGMNLVFFNDAMEHLCRIHRIIRQPRGNALLVGLGGSGRSSLTRLAAFLAGYSVFQIEIEKKYDLNRFHEDLRTLYKVTGGIKKQQRVFYFSDNQIMQTAFLEDLNNMLSTGEIPNLFPKDEIQLLRDELRKEAMEAGCKDSLDEIYGFFIGRARKNIHLVVAMSPAHKDFRLRLRQFPGLVSCTTIDWFVDWPNEALKEVGVRCISEASALEFDTAMAENVADVFMGMHDETSKASVRLKETLKRFNYVTPSSYLDLVRGYCQLYVEKREAIKVGRGKLANGMTKLEETQKAVGTMEQDLKVQEANLKTKTAEVEAQMDQIRQKTMQADEQKEVLKQESTKIQREKDAAEVIKAECEEDLEKATPALNDAEAALNALDKKELQELKTYTTPPAAVKMVMEAVQLTLKRPIEWPDAKKSLNESDFLQRLVDFDRETMALEGKIAPKLEKYINRPEYNFEAVKKVSTAAAGLCAWSIAIFKFCGVFKEVHPKKMRLQAAEKKVAAMERDLLEKQRGLQRVMDSLAKLQKEAEEGQMEKENLQRMAAETKEKMRRADIIVKGLEGEQTSWTDQIKQYDERLSTLAGDVLLASGFMSYAGAFPAEYREDLQKLWMQKTKTKIEVSRHFKFVEFMAEPTEVRDWQNDGLPGDGFSSENGVIVVNGRRWPLMVDPQGQANKWIKKMEGKELKVVDVKMDNYLKQIEYAVQFGVPVLLQDVLEDLDPSLDTVLSKAIIVKGNSKTIKIGENYIEYNDNFKLYITTKLANPHYTPEICTKICLINFAVKDPGLEEQLLKIVVEEEKKELEEKNEQLILENAANEKEKKRLEDQLLDLLANSEGSLLDNLLLVETLQTSKETQATIKQQLEAAVKTREEIARERALYRPCATRASILFFVLADMGAIDNMYQFSLESYILLFRNSIKWSRERLRADKNDNYVKQRVENLNIWHTEQVYKNTCRGLFEKHKLLFSFHMTMRILFGEQAQRTGPDAGAVQVQEKEYAFFMKGGVVLEKDSQAARPEFLSEGAWDNICELEKLVRFHGIVQSFESSSQQWFEFFKHPSPEEATLPGEFNSLCADNYFLRMIIVRSIRPDRIVFMTKQFIQDERGEEFIKTRAPKLMDSYEDSTALLPLVIVLSPGVDPAKELIGLAESKGRTLKQLALGQGQDKIARTLILEGAQSGGWVFLANCHLMISWLPELEKIIDELADKQPKDTFRLWLSSTPTPAFPIGILQRAIKTTTEPPTGLRANMEGLYDKMDEQHFLDNSGDRPQLYRPLLFALCYFHSVLLERRKFAQLGYNVKYDFTSSDFEVSDNIIALYVKGMPDPDPKHLPLTTMRYLISEASYGGRVTDDWDRRVINTYIESFIKVETCAMDNFPLCGNSTYHVPNEDGVIYNLQVFREFTRDLPLTDDPEAFGQHPNADIASQIDASMGLLDDMMTVNATLVRGGGGGGGGGGDKKVQTLEDVALDALKRLDEQVPLLINYEMILEQTVEDHGTALNTCLLQEIQRYNVLLVKLKKQKDELRRAVKGELVMNEELDTIFNALLIGRVPPPWLSAYPSTKPLASWVQDLIKRVNQLVEWGRAMPKRFWLSGFTYPTGFLKSLQQQRARREQISIDQYGWQFDVRPYSEQTVMHAPKEGAYIYGIYLEGAGWHQDAGYLCEPTPMELMVNMPMIHFIPARREGKVKVKNLHVTPLYMYPIRTGTRERPSFVLGLDIPTKGEYESEVWTKRGTALLLSTSE